MWFIHLLTTVGQAVCELRFQRRIKAAVPLPCYTVSKAVGKLGPRAKRSQEPAACFLYRPGVKNGFTFFEGCKKTQRQKPYGRQSLRCSLSGPFLKKSAEP